jgi:hypothetical protein
MLFLGSHPLFSGGQIRNTLNPFTFSTGGKLFEGANLYKKVARVDKRATFIFSEEV